MFCFADLGFHRAEDVVDRNDRLRVDVLKQPAQSQDKGKGEIQPPSRLHE